MVSMLSKIEWRAPKAEFIATFLFVFLGAGSVIVSGNLVNGLDPARLIVIALAHGLAIAVLVSATAHLSGGHINPAVTFGAMITKKISMEQGILYIVAQLAGAALAALLLVAVIPGLELGEGGLGSHALGSGVEAWQGVILEAVLTFALVFTVFSAAMDKRGVANMAPLIIGLVVAVDHFIGVPLTGASMNPARTFGPALAAGAWTDWWVYWVGPLAGGALAALGYKYIYEQK